MIGAAGDDAVAPAAAFLRLLGRGTKHTAGSWEEGLCQLAGVTLDAARDAPVAALSRSGETGRQDGYFWIRADLVHKRADRDQLVMLGRAAVAVDTQFSDEVARRVRPLVEEEGLIFEVATPNRWYIGAKDDPLLRTYPPSEAMGRPLNEFLPKGKGRHLWQRLMTEVQMVMHQVLQESDNAVLQQRGPNSVWFWGVGVLPQGPSSIWDDVAADDPLALGLGRLMAASTRPLPRNFDDWLAGATGNRRLLVMPMLEAAAEPLAEHAYAAQFASIVDDWLTPLAHWLSRGGAARVSIYIGGGLLFDCKPGDRWRVWRSAAIKHVLARPE